MNCERCQIELEDFLYGELTERMAAEVRQHLVGCTECAAERDRLESENALFAEFYEHTAIDPAAESWELVRARIAAAPGRAIQQEKAAWWKTMFGWLMAPALARQMALAILLIAVSVATTMWVMRRGNDGKQVAEQKPTPVVTPQTGTPDSTPPPKNELALVEPTKAKPQVQREPVQTRQLNETELLAQQLVRAEREYQSAIKLLDRAVAKRRNEIQPEAFKKYESSLALIDSSIAQSKRALREFPNDAAAGQFLLAAYARKVELMQEVAMQ